MEEPDITYVRHWNYTGTAVFETTSEEDTANWREFRQGYAQAVEENTDGNNEAGS
jgi:hypothetical protein